MIMRRRKSSCPNIEPRRPSATPNRSAIKLDLYIEDDELHTGPGRRNSPSPTINNDSRRRSSTNVEDTAEEVLCLRLLSTRTRYRFGGLRLNLISPVFNVDKLFNVEFDQDSQIALIKSQQSSWDNNVDHHNSSFFKEFDPTPPGNDSRKATIVIEPESEDQKDEITRQLPLMTADLTLLEVDTGKSSQTNKSHAAARSLTRIPEPEIESIKRTNSKRHQSTSSINNNNNNNGDDNVKVYNSGNVLEPTPKSKQPQQQQQQQMMEQKSILESINLESKELQNKTKKLNKQKSITEMRRHTHFYCHIPTPMSSKR